MKIVGLYLLIAFTPARAFFYSSSDPIDCVWLPWRYTACIRVGDGDFRKVENRTKIEAMFGGRDCISENSSRTTERCSAADYITTTILSAVSVRPESRDVSSSGALEYESHQDGGLVAPGIPDFSDDMQIATHNLNSMGFTEPEIDGSRRGSETDRCPQYLAEICQCNNMECSVWEPSASHGSDRRKKTKKAISICFYQTYDVPAAGQTRTINYLFDANYPGDQTCQFHIKVPEDDRIRITFTTFDLETHLGCSYDYLQVYDGPNESSPTLNILCGNELPAPIETQGNEATLQFVSDGSVHRHGFILQFTTVNDRDICNQTFDVLHLQTRTIKYLFDTNYPGDQTCIFHIRGTGAYRPRITFTTFDIGTNLECSNDYLQVYDGPSTSSPTLEKLCGNEIPAPIETRGNVATLKFVSDEIGHRPRFILRFTDAKNHGICDRTFHVLAGQTRAMKFSLSLGSWTPTCVIHIRGPRGDRLRITSKNSNHLTHRGANDNLQVYDGRSTSSPTLGTLYGNASIETQGNVATLVYVWDSFTHHTDSFLQLTTVSTSVPQGKRVCARTFNDLETGIRMLGADCSRRRRRSIDAPPAKLRVKRQFGGNIVGKKYRDVLFLLDESGSVGQTNFQKELEFVITIAGKFCDEQRIGQDNTRVAVTTFSTDHANPIEFRDSYGYGDFRRAVEKIRYRSEKAGSTCLIKALRAARNETFTKRKGSRVPHGTADGLLILVTDGCLNCFTGDATQLLQAEQKSFEELGISILTFMINVGGSCQRSFKALQDGSSCFQGFSFPSWAQFDSLTTSLENFSDCFRYWTKNSQDCP